MNQSNLAKLLVDEIECGMIVCDDHGTIQFLNQSAQRELSSCRVLQRHGAELRSVRDANEFKAAVSLAFRRGLRHLVSLGRGADRLLVSVLPLRDSGAIVGVLLVLGQRHPCSELGLEMLAAFHGLTLTERRVMAGLLHRRSPREIAQQHQVAMSTVRTQIQSIRSKLNTRSIDELLLRAAEVPPVASALRAQAAPLHLAA